MAVEGVKFITSVNVGVDITAEELAEHFDEEMHAFKMPEMELEQVAGGICNFQMEHCRYLKSRKCSIL